ncbi:hypothetical protein RvY_16282 [Ramazzottius varieornatus]|uniref:Uncharacterized protein n=1 Tax=Ramazzottius varieornatus TaxID=947166 RepID=A0A1D1W4D9_RAMVA|nr:hypothetical protein RvY_16282 [Ramazzottius varieornatus]
MDCGPFTCPTVTERMENSVFGLDTSDKNMCCKTRSKVPYCCGPFEYGKNLGIGLWESLTESLVDPIPDK